MATASSAIRSKMTLAEFYALPEGAPQEFDEGEGICLPEPHTRHSRIQGRLFVPLHIYISERKIGEIFLPINVQLDDDHSYAPDLTYLSSEHIDRHDEVRGRIIGSPDLVIEIISPRGGETRDRVRKFQVYYSAKVPWYWIVESMTLAIEEYQWKPDGYLCTARVAPGEAFKPLAFPGLEINLESIVSESNT